MHTITLLTLTILAAVIESETEIVRRGKALSKIVPNKGSFYIADGNEVYKLNTRFDEVEKANINEHGNDNTITLILVDEKNESLISSTNFDVMDCTADVRFYSNGESHIKLDFVDMTNVAEGYVTTLSKTKLEGSDVILAGTANGFVLKYVLDEDNKISKFESFQIEKDVQTPIALSSGLVKKQWQAKTLFVDGVFILRGTVMLNVDNLPEHLATDAYFCKVEDDPEALMPVTVKEGKPISCTIVGRVRGRLDPLGQRRNQSGQGIAGTVSGVEAAIHCGDELWFGVGMEVSERDQNLAINTGRNGPGAHLESSCRLLQTSFTSNLLKVTVKLSRIRTSSDCNKLFTEGEERESNDLLGGCCLSFSSLPLLLSTCLSKRSVQLRSQKRYAAKPTPSCAERRSINARVTAKTTLATVKPTPALAVSDCPHLERIHSKYIPSGVDTNLTLEIGNLNKLKIATEFSIHVEFHSKTFNCSDITNGSSECTVNRMDDVYVQSMEPKKGPAIGGTVISLFGKNLGIGNRVVQNVKFLSREDVLPTSTCKHSKVQSEHLAMTVFENFYVTCEVSIDVDREPGTNMTFEELEIPVEQQIKGKHVLSDLIFKFLPNPEIRSIHPTKGFLSGGTILTVKGQHLNSSNVGTVSISNEKETQENCIIDPNSADQVLCKVPNATVGVRNALESNTPSNSQRKKRSSHCDGCVTVDILVKLDGVESHFTISYYHDPSINKFDENVLLYQTDQQYLEIKGENLNLVAEMHDINVTIGLGECNVVELTGTYMRCKAPSSQPQPGIPGATLPEVNVTIGNIQRTVGYIEYQKKFENVLIIAGAAAGTALFLLVLVVAFFVCKYRKVGSKAKALEKQLNDLELEIKHVAKEEFLDMQTSMSTVNRNLIEQGFPYHSYQQYACNAMFATDYLMSDPVMSDELRARARTGMERFQGLLENKFFLVSLITTMEKQKHFFIKEKSNFAGNLCAIMMGRMDYMHDYSIRIWAMLIKTPSILFDINAPSYVSESLDVISQVFIESFSRTEQAVSKNQQETTFNKNAALYRLYEQIKPYTDEILDDLSICQETRCLQLNKKLDDIFSMMEE
ncbi:PLXB1-like protein [Mya arenaria]|uniref:PLXB1-like protein n=1 Tax=Mya arenaria TaxID=6604 RepID=A0ABY7FVB6_MYAAR|nr:PLXB1-like protein [Mya arenaria]